MGIKFSLWDPVKNPPFWNESFEALKKLKDGEYTCCVCGNTATCVMGVHTQNEFAVCMPSSLHCCDNLDCQKADVLEKIVRRQHSNLLNF